MSANTVGKWLKALAGITAAVGLYTFSDSQIENVEVWLVSGWAAISAAINTLQAWAKSRKA